MKPGGLRFRDHDILAQRLLAPLSRAVAALALQLLCCFEVRALSGSLVSSTPE
jgi:hypothetical protein